jgi:subtilisin family serine protease
MDVVRPRTILPLKRGLVAAAVLLVSLPGGTPAQPTPAPLAEVVVTLDAPPLAEARAARSLSSRRLSITAPRNLAYLRTLEAAQRTLATRITTVLPGSSVRWRYSIVANGLAVTVPRADVARLASIRGVDRIWPSVSYHALLDRSPALIGAPRLWGPNLTTAGQGTKIGIIDDGVDQSHPFFAPAGYAYPPGFPKGDTRFTTPKVVVARAFAPAGTTYANAKLPFDPRESEHATHVAGIAAGNNGTLAEGFRISGIAPRAYLGNYKALSLPTPDFGLDGNSPELVAAIEAAVGDGMDVINLSLGEPEIDPARDIVVQALDAAADAGVVPVVAAGNDFLDFGHGSVGSPANAPKAISTAASTGAHGSPTPDRIASFSSAGPTPYSLQLKPDVAAPGAQVLSSVPQRVGLWDTISGTSMASPHVAGAAALLRERHPSWTVAQIKSALVLTGAPVHSGRLELETTREGGGRIDLVHADDPLVFAQPSSLGFGLVRPGHAVTRRVALTDAGGGGGAWAVGLQLQGSGRGISIRVPKETPVPGTLTVRAGGRRGAAERDVTGFVVVRRTDGVKRRIPFWFRIARRRLALDPAHPLTRPGVHRGSTVGAPSRVSRYRYPDLEPSGVSFPVRLGGPEVVYRFRLRRPVANFGVVLLRRGPVQPRIVRAADENRLTGYTALPLDLNPYRSSYGATRPVAAAVLPAPGSYDVVFDSTARARRGPFVFRFWIDDRTPPTIRVLSVRGTTLKLSVQDRGSGVDPSSLHATVDRRLQAVSFSRGLARVSLAGLAAGRRTLIFKAADFQETKNMEDVGPVLPNTRTFRTTIVVP